MCDVRVPKQERYTRQEGCTVQYTVFLLLFFFVCLNTILDFRFTIHLQSFHSMGKHVFHKYKL